jgi:hypothetical protein
MNRAAVAAMGMGESEFVEAISHPFVKEREIQEEQRRGKNSGASGVDRSGRDHGITVSAARETNYCTRS